jgi:hypothetical protein
MKSKLLLEGVYEPNIVTKASDLTSDVMDFIKKNKNHLCENFTISDIYDATMVAQEQVKGQEQEKRLRATKKGPSHEKLMQKQYLKNLIKGNANRNLKELAVKEKVNEHHQGNGGGTGNGGNEVSLGPHKLSEEQLRKIYALID